MSRELEQPLEPLRVILMGMVPRGQGRSVAMPLRLTATGALPTEDESAAATVTLTDVYKAATTTKANDTLASDAALQCALTAGKIYRFRIVAQFTTGAADEGIKATLATSDTLTATNITADVTLIEHNDAGDDATIAVGRVTALGGTAIGLTTSAAGNGTLIVEGTIEVNAAGTLELQWAKNASTGATVTSVLRGSVMTVQEV